MTIKSRRRKNQRRVLASLLTGVMVIQPTMLGAFASNISSAGAGVTHNGNTYTINPQDILNQMGYRNYTDFNLTEGDIANLIFNGDMKTFVNLVDNKIIINGVLNSMRENGTFANGKVVFVSPNGMLVGSSGVLNVGSLGVYTPNSSTFNSLKNKHNENGAALLFDKDGEFYNSGKIEINGKILAVNDVVLKGHTVNIGQGGGIIAGVAESQMLTTDASKVLFDNLVKGDYKNAAGFSSANGVITIETAPPEVSTAGTGVNISGSVYNNATNGTVTIQNTTGDLNITSTGYIRNNGTTNIKNTPFDLLTDTNTGKVILAGDLNTQLNMNGKVETNGTLNIANTGKKGANVGGTINHKGALNIQNGYIPTSAAGNRNNDIAALNITADITNTQGTTDITNYAAGGLNIQNGTIDNQKGNLNILNTGVGGLTTAGAIKNNGGSAAVTNQAGAMNIGGTFINNGQSTFTNEQDATTLDINGNITNTGGRLEILNNGSGAFTTAENSHINASNDLIMTNNGAGGMNLNGEIIAAGQTDITNNKDNLAFGGSFEGNGVTNITNSNTANALNITGSITNRNNKLTITNNGAGAFTTQAGSEIDSAGLRMENNGSGFTMNGTVNNNGAGDYVNNNGSFEIGGTVQNTSNTANFNNNGAGTMTFKGTVNNTGTTNVTNSNRSGKLTVGGGFSNNGTTTITNDGTSLELNGNMNNTGATTITNNGAGGFDVKGSITNNGSKLTMVNTNGAFKAHQGSLIDAKNGLEINNSGNGGLTTAGTIKNEVSEIKVLNSNGAMDLGGELTNVGHATITNNTGATGLTVRGKITNSGDTLTITNKGSGEFNTLEGSQINASGLKMENSGSGFNMNGRIVNTGTGHYINNNGNFNIGGNIKNKSAKFENKGTGAMTFSGSVENEGTTTVTNSAQSGKLTVGGVFTNTGATTFTNDGSDFEVTGYINNKGDKLTINNNKGSFTVAEHGKVQSANNLDITNNGEGGIVVSGIVENDGVANIKNTKGDLKINNKVTNRRGKLTLLNTSDNGGLYIYSKAKVTNEDNNTQITNTGDKGLHIQGEIENGGLLALANSGADAINISGNVHSAGDITMANMGDKGVRITSGGRVNGDKNITITNTVTKTDTSRTTGAVNVEGIVKANENLNITSTNGNVALGHAATENNLQAGNNVDITVNDGSLLNNGVEKTLIKAGGNLTMDVKNGSIGEAVQQTGLTNSTGIGPKAQGSRDFTKSINANVNGKVKASTHNTAAEGKELVINYASIGNDMKIDTIKADGRVILTVDDDFGKTNTEQGKHKYSMINANTEGGTNVEGWGISLIADNNIGSKDNMITFIQTDAANHKMDALANNSIYLKENSYNAYGRDGEVTQNSVSTMIAREGDMYVEFAGNTKIDNITAEGDMTVITRGKNLEIENLGHIVDPSVTPADYFGPRHDGYQFDGRYNKDDYKSDILPNNVTVKALDINHNIRPTEETLPGGNEAWANSTVRIKNAVIDNGKMNITADNIYANGIYAGFNKDGFTKKHDTSTNKIAGVIDPDSFNIPVGKAVRPGDVTGIGRGETERNYYYPAGDGDITINGNTTKVDPDDNIAEATPLEIVDGPTPPPIIPPGPGPGPGPDDPDPTIPDNQDGKMTWKKVDDNDVEAIDKRQYMRFGIATNEQPVMLEKTNNGIDELLDVSRGGIAVSHSNKLKVGDVIPVHLTYGDLDIKADVKVVTATTNRAGASFINLDKATANKLLYLNILLEDNTISFR